MEGNLYFFLLIYSSFPLQYLITRHLHTLKLKTPVLLFCRRDTIETLSQLVYVDAKFRISHGENQFETKLIITKAIYLFFLIMSYATWIFFIFLHILYSVFIFVILEISFLVIEQMELFSLFLSSYEKDELISYVRPTEVDQILISLERDYVVEKVE